MVTSNQTGRFSWPVWEALLRKYMFIWALPGYRLDPFATFLGTLWHLFFAENEKISKTAMTVVKNDKNIVF